MWTLSIASDLWPQEIHTGLRFMASERLIESQWLDVDESGIIRYKISTLPYHTSNTEDKY